MLEHAGNTVVLNDGNVMPRVMFGTWDIRGEAGYRALLGAIENGYRGIDTAFMYNNHEIVGKAVADCGVSRQELFITSKLNRPYASYKKAVDGIKRALDEMGLGYLDLMLVHEPYTATFDMYRACEEARQQGLVRSVGVSNLDEPHMRQLLDNCEVVPAVDQVESHVYFPQLGLNDYLAQQGIAMQAWGPFTEGQRPIFSDAVLNDVAARHSASGQSATAGQVALAYLLQNGINLCVKSGNSAHQVENLAALDVELSADELTAVAKLDGGHSLFNWYGSGWIRA